MSVCQFTIPRIAAEAIDLTTARARARAAGYEHPRFEQSTINAGWGKVRITCSSEMTKFFISILTERADHSDAETRQACLDGAAAARVELQQSESGLTQRIAPNRMG